MKGKKKNKFTLPLTRKQHVKQIYLIEGIKGTGTQNT